MNDGHPRSGSGKRWIDKIRLLMANEPQSRDELIQGLRSSHKRELLDADALAMMEGALKVSEMQARDAMIPRAQMVTVPADADFDTIMSVIVESGHSRFPVLAHGTEEIVGALLAKDMLKYCADEGHNFSLKSSLRPIDVIPESKRLNVLLKEFKSTRRHMAVIMDEFGTVSGLITIEDVLEEIVGEIDDEHDVENGGSIFQQSENVWLVKALTPVDEFNEFFSTRLADEDFDTVGGLVVNHFGRLPNKGESAQLENFQFVVAKTGPRQVLQFVVERVT